jgi:hypothetical protein
MEVVISVSPKYVLSTTRLLHFTGYGRIGRLVHRFGIYYDANEI